MRARSSAARDDRMKIVGLIGADNPALAGHEAGKHRLDVVGFQKLGGLLLGQTQPERADSVRQHERRLPLRLAERKPEVAKLL